MRSRGCAALLVAAALGAGACGRGDGGERESADHETAEATEKLRCDPATGLSQCGAVDGDLACTWGRLFERRADVDSLAGVLAGDPADLDQSLRLLFPAIGSKPIVDGELPPPTGAVFRREKFAPYVLPVPVNWQANPHHNNTWQLYFQSLSWLHEYWQGDDPRVDVGAAILVDWVDHALHAAPPLRFAWESHATVMRLDRTIGLVEAYIAGKPVLNRRFLHAAAQLILTHLYGMAAGGCYAPQHNHSVMVDLALLDKVRRFPALRDGDRFLDIAERRLLDEQVARSVTDDGIHVENSPGYHLYFIELLQQAIETYLGAGAAIPPALIAAHDAMIEPLVHMLQPDLTLAQFGDTDDEEVSRRLARLLAKARALGVGDPARLQPLIWAVAQGGGGSPPATLDRVYLRGGYAFFRDRWDLGAGAPSITAQFKSSRLSKIHYHADETAFELFAHGHPLIVGPGYFTYDTGDPFRDYQRSPAAQNVLVVDDDAKVPKRAGAGSKLIDHGSSGDTVWVQGTHENFRRLGIKSLVRTFAYARPDTFVVVDHVSASGRHQYDQHLRLHPGVTTVDRAGERSLIARVPGGPSLVITSGVSPAAIEIVRGVKQGAVRQGWYFPGFQVAVPAHDVVFRHERSEGEVDLPLLLTIVAPGKRPHIPTDVSYSETADRAIIGWRAEGARHRVEVPRR